MKYGALVGLILAGASLAGVPDWGWGAHRTAEAAPVTQQNPTTASIRQRAEAADDGVAAPEVILQESDRIQLASNTTSIALSDLMMGQVGTLQTSCADIYLNIRANITSVAVGTSVDFFSDSRIGGPNGDFPETAYVEFYFPDEEGEVITNGVGLNSRILPAPQTPTAGINAVSHTYENEGTFDVGMRIRVRAPDGTLFFCPPTDDDPFIIEDFITVAQENAANFNASSLVESGLSIPPMSDWVPIIAFQMSYPEGEDSFAPRALGTIRYSLTGDPDAGDRDYPVFNGPINFFDILEFGLFRDFGEDGPDEVLERGTVDPAEPMLRWDAQGYPYAAPNASGDFGLNDTNYFLNFIFDPQAPGYRPGAPLDPLNPQFPFIDRDDIFDANGDPAVIRDLDGNVIATTGGDSDGGNIDWVVNSIEPGRGYIIAMRTSTTWKPYQHFSAAMTSAVMVQYNPPFGELPLDPVTLEPERVDTFGTVGEDSYTPDFPGGEILEAEPGFSSTFSVFDVRGGAPLDARLNNWNYVNYLYTPNAEFNRRRFDLGESVLDTVLGETLDLREMFSLEQWTPILGFDMHGAETEQPYEINVIVTDVGGDPYLPKGNGGMDAEEGLERLTSRGVAPGGDANLATGIDFSFNGVGLWHDTNDDGQFNPPTQNSDFAISFNGGDYPMFPDFTSSFGNTGSDIVIPGAYEWEYVPFPPGGGDPWYKARLRYFGGRRRNPTDTPTGFFDPVPDNLNGGPKMDYFLVVRADSGFRDVSGVTGDGTAMPLGTDARVFIEPRRWNARGEWTEPQTGIDRVGHWDGGVLATNQFGSEPIQLFNGNVEFWQDLPDYDNVCLFDEFPCVDDPAIPPRPFWPERTNNRDLTKPIKMGVEIHDLVLTYSTNNNWAKEKVINESSDFTFFQDPPIIPIALIADPLLGGVLDSVGVLRARFVGLFTFFSTGDVLFFTDDDRTPDRQFAYETVPFKLNDSADSVVPDAQLRDPRSVFFPDPPPQPTLPEQFTWPPSRDAVVAGFDSYCYLESEGSIPNLPYNDPAGAGGNGVAAEATYEDDVYVFVGEDCVGCNQDLSGYWLIDRNNAKFRIVSNVGNRFTLDRGHEAYIDEFYHFRNEQVGNVRWPFEVPVGETDAVSRGPWFVVEDALRRGQYSHVSDWPSGLAQDGGLRAARLLKQHVNAESVPTAMVGVNVTGVLDNFINNNEQEIGLNSITVAFWGPEFDPSDLNSLDPDGSLVSSGVLLYEDSTGNGVFNGPFFSDLSPVALFRDRIVPLEPGSLKWSRNPEPVDVDGDFEPDDMSGDGFVALTQADVELLEATEPDFDGLLDTAWVLRLQPGAKWQVPHTDPRGGIDLDDLGKSGTGPRRTGLSYSDTFVFTQELAFSEDDGLATTDTKALPLAGSPGDDLFVVIRTSDTIGQFEQFRCIVPSKLPSRTPTSETVAGVEFSPQAYPVVDSFVKTNPEESAVADLYGHDMLEVSVPSRIVDLSETLFDSTVGAPVVGPGREAAAVLGIDASANRPDNLVAEGTGGSISGNIFTTSGVQAPSNSAFYVDGAWTSEAVGCYVIGFGNDEIEQDRRLESFEITAVAGSDLTLRAGAPAVDSVDAPWFVVKDPTFLEQVVVEFYDTSEDGNFDLQNDFAPLDFEDPLNGNLSGVALYRDNDFHPSNTNGEFDPPVRDEDGNVIEYIDLPVRLDDPPVLIGVSGEPEYQVKFVFSSPGTDDLVGRDAVDYEDQPSLRQWIPQTFGQVPDDPNFGSDFFVVVRPSVNMSEGDDFSAAIVSWGPDTPTAPDPDNFSPSLRPGQLPGQRADEFDLFEEFPWGSRGLGYITMFRDPPPIYYWNFDKDEKKIVARAEVDRSQDDRDVRYWVRSNPAVTGRSLPITALPPFTVDFEVDRNRQLPGEDVQFTLVTDGAVRSVQWEFGDGETSTERNPIHQYDQVGVYTVRLIATDIFGVEAVVVKEDVITIIEAPFADFNANPKVGNITPDPDGVQAPGLNVSFIDLSIGGDEYTPISYFWNFGDGDTLLTEARATEENPVVHRYTQEGFYDVTLAVTFRNVNTNETEVEVCTLEDLITVRACVGCEGSEGEGEGEGEGGGGDETPASTFETANIIRDNEALVPLHDWVPLFNFTMRYPADDPAPRFLRRLVYDIQPDQRDPADLNYGNLGGPEATDILEFGLFVENNCGCDDLDGTLDFQNDFLLYTWDNRGAPLGSLTQELDQFLLRYDLDFVGSGTAADPEFPVLAGPETDDDPDGESYIVAMRTSSTWRSQLTTNVVIQGAEMIIPNTGTFPVDDEGEPVDDYPEFPVEEDASYSSSFTVWDVTGSPTGTDAIGYFDTWNHPAFLYTPLAEHTRPKWNQADRILDIIAGEFLEMRELVSLDTWTPVIGINLHSTRAVHFLDSVGSIRFEDEDAAQLREVNVVLTDIDADPLGPPGNGGFNPRTGLERMTSGVWGAPILDNEAFAEDFSFNGIWVWHDTNGDGLFQGPEINPDTGGISFPGDRPLLPSAFDGFFEDSFTEWEWIPNPPGGGDPWWKIRMRFFSGERRGLDAIIDDANTDGYIEPTPDNEVGAFSGSEYTNDFFVVVRTDSGFKDASLGAPDNTGISMGADFRAFIEPRRFSAETGSQSGGIYVDSMIPSLYPLTGTWQDDVRWGEVEPWWPERTVNRHASKPLKVGVDVHDLVMTYESDSQYRVYTDLFFGDGSFHDTGCLGFADGFGDPTDFGFWTDPFGLSRARFLNGHSPGVTRWRLFGQETVTIAPLSGPSDTIILAFDDTNTRGQFAYETVPFRQSELPENVRSAAFPNPPEQPTLPRYSNWSQELQPDELPRASQWAPEDSQARLLTQKGDINSYHVPLLGINTVGSADPFVNDGGNEITMTQLTVAFWGPDFNPTDLAALDATGLDPNSGVILWEDTNADGVFSDLSLLESYLGTGSTIPGGDAPVPLQNLRWPTEPEPIDLDGDGAPDDMNGDGRVGTADYAWVLTFVPENLWEVPHEDGIEFDFNGAIIECGSFDFSKGGIDEVLVPTGTREEAKRWYGKGALKALDVETVQPGDDLFVSIKTSDRTRRFEKIRAVIPATLPARDESERKAGIQFFPQVNTSASAFAKSNPDEDSVQDFYGHDTLEINIPVKIVDMTNQNQSVTIGGAALPVFGLDLSTNRGESEGTLAQGTDGAGSDASFAVTGATWTANAFAGDWLIDANYEPFQILSNTSNTLNLLSGTPASGVWRVVREPSYLEQVVVEFYNEGIDSDFNPRTDLLPLKRDMEISGVAIYRDNDSHPENQNGVFQPDIDIPIPLDATPVFIGQAGEDTQVKFVFSTPGTDGIGAAITDPDTGQLVPAPDSALAKQSRNRQWVPDTFGANSSSDFFGPDFFVVVRASHGMEQDDNFRMGLVSWGPNTPTEPDPDTWAGIDSEARNEFAQFREFPWSVRGLGFITFFKDPPVRYFMDGTTAGAREDSSGFNWVRSHTAKKKRSGVITAKTRAIGPFSVVIDGATPTQLPSQTLDGSPFNVVIRGKGFGTKPTVVISGYDVNIRSANDTSISVDISTVDGQPPTEPIVLIVRNPDTKEVDSRSDIFTLVPGNASAKPVITGVNPNGGDQHDFPVEVLGTNFPDMNNIVVMFGKTMMPVLSVRPDGTGVSVGYPANGLPTPGGLDVMVRNASDGDSNANNDPQDVMLNGFMFENDATRPAKTSLFGCGPASTSGGAGGDMLVLLGVVALLLAAWYRRGAQA